MSFAEDDAVETLGELDLHLHARLLALNVNVSHRWPAAGLPPALSEHRLSKDRTITDTDPDIDTDPGDTDIADDTNDTNTSTTTDTVTESHIFSR